MFTDGENYKQLIKITMKGYSKSKHFKGTCFFYFRRLIAKT